AGYPVEPARMPVPPTPARLVAPGGPAPLSQGTRTSIPGARKCEQPIMPTATVSLPVLPADRPLRLTPTDVTQFVRMGQCDRHLRLRLAERAGQDFMEEYGVVPQRISPL